MLALFLRILPNLCSNFARLFSFKFFCGAYAVKCHKIVIIYPQPIRRNYHTKYTFSTLAPVSYLRSLVVRCRFDPCRRTYIVDEFFSTFCRLEFRHVYNFHWILRHINPSENSPHRVKCHKIVMIYPQPM